MTFRNWNYGSTISLILKALIISRPLPFCARSNPTRKGRRHVVRKAFRWAYLGLILLFLYRHHRG
jgi:hypothetical protein